MIISTHTSRVGCDQGRKQLPERAGFLLTHPVWDVTIVKMYPLAGADISTHTSRVGCDATALNHLSRRVKFLLTHPVWDVTAVHTRTKQKNRFLLTHPVWDVTSLSRHQVFFLGFLLTHPVWDVTRPNVTYSGIRCISTHTSRVGCDSYI